MTQQGDIKTMIAQRAFAIAHLSAMTLTNKTLDKFVKGYLWEPAESPELLKDIEDAIIDNTETDREIWKEWVYVSGVTEVAEGWYKLSSEKQKEEII